MSITSVWRSSSKPVNEHPNIQDRHRGSGSRTGSAEASGILSHVGWTGDGDHNPHQIRSYTGAVNGHLSPVTAAHVGHDRSHAMSIILATGGAATPVMNTYNPRIGRQHAPRSNCPGLFIVIRLKEREVSQEYIDADFRTHSLVSCS